MSGKCVFLAFLGLLISPGSGRIFGQTLYPTRDCSAYPYAPPYPIVAAGYVPRYHTVVHKFLDEEQGVGPVTPTEYSILDSLLDEAKMRLKPIPTGLDAQASHNFAIRSLKAIDCMLVRHGFVYPGRGLVQLLSDGLDPTYFSGSYLSDLQSASHNAGRGAFIAQRGGGPFYVVDCDIASYLYLAIGEVMGYPLAMVDLPKHNFIRWLRPDGTYIDFETMDGFETNDQCYFSQWLIPPAFRNRPGGLTTMTGKQLDAYEYFGLGVSITWKHDYLGSIAAYLKAIAIDATLSDSANNLSWLYTVVPNPGLREPKKAVYYGEQAASIFPDGDVLDTLACAYDSAGDFVKAEDAENRAIALDWAPQGSAVADDLLLIKARKPCEDPTFGTDKDPFRQPVAAPGN